MTWTFIWTRPALRDMKKFERRLARRIRDGVVGNGMRPAAEMS